MSQAKSPETKERRVPLRIRVVHDASGGPPRAEPMVHCARRGKSIDAHRCVECARMKSMQWAPDEGGEIACAAADESVARPAGHGPDPKGVTEAASRTTLHEAAGKVTVCVTAGASLSAVRALFAERALRCAPVVDDEGKLVGIVSRTDLLAEDAAADGEVRSVMRDRVHALPEHAPVGFAVALMAFEQISAVPVVTNEGELIGLFTALDALAWLAPRMGYVAPRRSP